MYQLSCAFTSGGLSGHSWDRTRGEQNINEKREGQTKKKMLSNRISRALLQTKGGLQQVRNSAMEQVSTPPSQPLKNSVSKFCLHFFKSLDMI